ncbi:MAG: hypothetical protein WCI74_21970 [Actinomycetes bacterium]
MRLGLVLCVAALILTGCGLNAGDPRPPKGPGATAAPSAEASIGVDVRPNDPSLPRTDLDGRLPDQSVLALIDALNKSQWRAAYSSYASPTPDLATASREWAAAHETYIDFRILETRVTDADQAWVRVAYSVSSNPMSSAIQPVIVDEPGEWWPLHKVHGVWKTQWMPRQ